MFRVFDGACKNLSLDTLNRFITQSMPIWHKKDRPIQHWDITALSISSSWCLPGLSFDAKLAKIVLETLLRCLKTGLYMPHQKLPTLWGLSTRFQVLMVVQIVSSWFLKRQICNKICTFGVGQISLQGLDLKL